MPGEMQVFIPSMGRVENLNVALPAWKKHFDVVNYVVAADEVSQYNDRIFQLGYRGAINVIGLPERVHGIGHIRRHIVNISSTMGLETIVMSDDDIIPHKTSDFDLSDWALRDGESILGVGCTTSYHSLLLGDRKQLLAKPDLIYCASGYGFRMFGLNIPRARAIGNFDANLHTAFEDAELMRCGIAEELSWYLDPNVKGMSLGKRYSAGGLDMMAGELRSDMEDECFEHCKLKWPAYLSVGPSGRKRMAWQKMLTDYIPRWREYL